MLSRYAAFVCRRSRLILIANVLLFAAFAAVGTQLFPRLQSQGFNDPSSGSAQESAISRLHFPSKPNLVVLVTARDGEAVDAPGVAAAGLDLTRSLSRQSGVAAVVSWWSARDPALRSRDGSQALILTTVTATPAHSSDGNAQRIISAFSEGTASLRATFGGSLGASHDIGAQVGADLLHAELLAIPITLVLLLLAFASVVAGVLPLVLGTLAIFGAFAALFILSLFTDVSIYSVNLATGLGLGLGIDYAFLMVSRFREELEVPETAIHVAVSRTLATAGHTIVFSALAVAAALSALLVFPLYFLRSFAYAGIGVVLIALLGALTTLPALLAVLGGRVNAGRLRRSGRVRSASAGSVVWQRIAHGVTRRPLLFALPVIAVLVLAATPLFHASFGLPDDRVLPPTAQSRQVGDALRSSFEGGQTTSLTVLLQGSPDETSTSDYAQRVSMLPDVQRVAGATGAFAQGRLVSPRQPADARFAVPGAQYLSVIGPADTQSIAAQHLVGSLRALPPPPGATALVGGTAAELVDGNEAIASHLWIAIAIIVVTTFVLLFLFSASVVLPLKALILNLLSLTAVFGAMVWIFQDGHGASVLGFTPGVVNSSMPVLLFCIAFGLSMDYEVFLLARIKEAHDEGATNHDAVVRGVSHTGRVITTAAAILSISFLAFVTSKVSFIQLFGLGTAIAILVDATVIRAVLVPAFMSLAGRWNWWAPRPLRRLHQRFLPATEPAAP